MLASQSIDCLFLRSARGMKDELPEAIRGGYYYKNYKERTQEET